MWQKIKCFFGFHNVIYKSFVAYKGMVSVWTYGCAYCGVEKEPKKWKEADININSKVLKNIVRDDKIKQLQEDYNTFYDSEAIRNEIKKEYYKILKEE